MLPVTTAAACFWCTSGMKEVMFDTILLCFNFISARPESPFLKLVFPNKIGLLNLLSWDSLALSKSFAPSMLWFSFALLSHFLLLPLWFSCFSFVPSTHTIDAKFCVHGSKTASITNYLRFINRYWRIRTFCNINKWFSFDLANHLFWTNAILKCFRYLLCVLIFFTDAGKIWNWAHSLLWTARLQCDSFPELPNWRHLRFPNTPCRSQHYKILGSQNAASHARYRWLCHWSNWN